MAAMMRRDRQIVGSYLRKPDNLFASMGSSSFNVDFLRALQDAGAVRRDVDLDIMSHVMDVVSYGLLTVADFRPAEELPPYEAVMEVIANMLDQQLTPEDGGNSEGGKAVIRRLAALSQEQFEAARKQAESKES
jgi:TetR/AcrR family acrAB operon transcriptional repressor